MQTVQEKIKAKLDALAKKTSGNGDNLQTHKFKPVPGKQVIRILPNTELGLDNEPFYPLDFYYEFGGTMLAPSQFDDPDPILDFYKTLTAESLPLKQTDPAKSLELFKAAVKFKPKTAIFVPVLVREKESEGVKFWTISPKTYEKLMSIIEDEDYGKIWDLKEGHDLTLDYTPKDKTSTGYPEISLVAKPKKTPVTLDKEVMAMVKNMPKLTEIYKAPTFEEAKDALEKYLNKSSSVSTPTPTVSKEQSDKEFLAEMNKPVQPATDADFDADLDAMFDDE